MRRLSLLIFSVCAAVLLAMPAGAASPRKWRAVYLEGGSYSNYQQMLAGVAQGLARRGLIDNGDVPVPADTESTRGMWDWLSRNAKGTIEFISDGYYSSNWDAKQRLLNKEKLLQRIKEKKDVDLILAFGTWSGVDMATADHQVPVFSMSVSDPVGAGIIKSPEDSGRDNVHSQVEPGRYKRQIAVFHEIFRFKRLGVPYEDTPEGRATCGMEEIEEAAKELGIELVRCTTQLDLPDEKQSFLNLRQCVRTLSSQSDAIYLTQSTGMEGPQMEELLQPVIHAGLPTFAQQGSTLVSWGILMSLAQVNFAEKADFEAEAIAKVIQGESPRNISQIFEAPLGLAINLKTAMQIGWNPPLEILAAVDEIYQHAQQKDNK